MRTASLLHAALLVTLTFALAQIIAPSIPLAAQTGARERTLFVSAVDDKREPVEGLGPDDFVVREDGARREVLRVSRAIEPIDVALLVDNSAASSDLIPRVREGLKGFIAAMTPQNALAIVGLADRPTIIVDYTSDPKTLINGIGRLFTQSSSGMTLLDAITEVSNGLEKRESPRAAIVPVITDGIEFSNRYYRDVINAMTRTGASLHALTVGTFPYSNDEPIRNREHVLGEGTQATGGQRVMLLSATAVEPALGKLARELLGQYKVVYSRPESLIPPEKTELTSSRAGVTVHGTAPRAQKSGA